MNSLEITIKPDWDEVDHVIHETEGFLQSAGYTDDNIHAMAMVAGELVENAVKYGDFQNQSEGISISVEPGREDITVTVRSPVNEEKNTNIRTLDKTIQWIRGYQNPFQAYVEKIRQIGEKQLEAGESGLGLVRIAYEGQSIVDFYVDEDNILCISAIHRTPGVTL